MLYLVSHCAYRLHHVLASRVFGCGDQCGPVEVALHLAETQVDATQRLATLQVTVLQLLLDLPLQIS